MRLHQASFWTQSGENDRLCCQAVVDEDITVELVGLSLDYRQVPLTRYWRTKRRNIDSDTHDETELATSPATKDPDAQPSFSLTHRQPQSCLTTEKSRSRTPLASTSCPRMSPTSRAASSCSTRQAHCEIFATAPRSNSSQWSYEEVEVRDISLTYVSPTISRRTPV